jgi:uncharacterized protein
VKRTDVSFQVGGERIAAWWWSGGAGRRPCVVLAHGAGGTKTCRLGSYAERFAAAGFHALPIDYRCFGDSDGMPRQLLAPRRQVDDLLAALAYVRSRRDVDPLRIALWGTSFGGGNVVAAAVRDGGVAAVISQCPVLDGRTAVWRALTSPGASPRSALRAAGAVASDLLAAATGGPPRRVPLVGPPGTVAAMTAVDAEPGYRRIAGSDWRNAVCARSIVLVARHRPVTVADRLPCPWLVQICDHDSVAPPSAALTAARRAGPRATTRRYPIGHFDIYVDDVFEQAVEEQVEFLQRRLGANHE